MNCRGIHKDCELLIPRQGQGRVWRPKPTRSVIETNTTGSAIASAIGVFGWSEIALPSWAFLLSLLGLIILWAGDEKGPDALSRGVGVLVQVALFMAIVLASLFFLYLQWSAVGAATIEGFQGRYLLPILPLLFYVSPFSIRLLNTKARRAVFVVAISVLSSSASLWAVAARYYA